MRIPVGAKTGDTVTQTFPVCGQNAVEDHVRKLIMRTVPDRDI